MKKTTLLLVLISFISIPMFSQLGIKAGFNYAKITDADKSLNNFQAGIFMDKDFIPLLKIRIGLDYSPKGGVFENSLINSSSQLNYLELPILLKLKFGVLYGLGGVYGAYAMNGTNTVTVGGVENVSDIDFDNYSRWDVGMKFGLGVQLKLGPLGAFAQTAYSFGMLDLNTSGIGGELKNTGVLTVSVGVLLGN